jgi:Holliday junction DNA helicase RuvA
VAYREVTRDKCVIIVNMIATLTGVVTEKLGDIIVLDVRGVGYGLLMTNEDFGRLATGQAAKVYVHEHIREQAHDLFGFCTLDTKQLFELLLGVNGVGPKMALSVLSVGSSNNVRAAIATGDVKYIQQASGVGKRVAERIVVDLKDKVGLEGVELSATGLLQGENMLMQDEAVEALVSLGYSAQDASVALQHVDPGLSTEERVKLALKGNR